jgi:hypothetical protein
MNWRTDRAIVAFIVGLAIAPTPASRAEEFSPLAGINIENPQRKPLPEQMRIASDLTKFGVKSIRIPLLGTASEPGDVEPAIAFAERAAKGGISILLNVFPDVPAEVRRRPFNNQFPTAWSVAPLSKSDPSLTSQRVARALKRFDEAGIKLLGIEVGNEINWAPFNGDFSVPGIGRVYSYEDINNDPALSGISEGLRQYVKVLQAVKAARDKAGLNRNTPIISAGLADPGSDRRLATKLDAIDIHSTLRFLKDQGLDDFVDGYGVHSYSAQWPPRPEPDRIFGQCGTQRGGKPCWLTEWGTKSALACPPLDFQRAELVGRSLKALESMHRDGRLAAAFYYQWNGEKDPLGLYRCGDLTLTGKVILNFSPRGK